MKDIVVKYYKTEEEIRAIVDGFRNRTLPAAAWTHEAHLITGLWFSYTYSHLETICHLRSGIIAYNISTGGENTPERGYHETLTLFWCRILHDFMEKNRTLTLVEACSNLLNSPWSSKELPFQYYSRETLFSMKARATWVQPDLKTL
jgi:hypothetical protein